MQYPISSSFVDLFDVLLICDLLLLFVLLLVVDSENGFDLSVKSFSAVPDEEDLQRVLDGDSAPELFVVHQELHEVEELSGLEASRVRYSPLVHRHELVFADHPVEVVVDLPDHVGDFGLGRVGAHLVESLHEVAGNDFAL